MNTPVHYHLGVFPPDNIEWTKLTPLIGKAHAALARYDGLVAAIPNARVLLSPLTTQEAVLSSRIEGTNATTTEVLEIEAGADGEGVTQTKRDDVEEILNYRQALSFAADALGERPFSQHLLREAHTLLMDGVRGRDKNPGTFRSQQNWIGPRGCPIEQATFIPIPQEHLFSGIELWSDYVQSEDELDPLVQLAITHVEFEAIHPFKDGNGRIGRMIIPLFLYVRDILSGPNFYISSYFEQRRDQYIETMRAVSRDGAWTDWCIFFLQGLIEQASDNQTKAQEILDLYRQMQRDVPELTHSQHAGRAVEFIFSQPIFSSNGFIEFSNIPKPTTLRILRVLRDAGILQAIREGVRGRPAIYAFPQLLNIVEGDNVL